MFVAAERDLAAAGARAYAALRDGVLAGGARLRMAEGVAQFAGAATAPAHRRRGVQTALLVRPPRRRRGGRLRHRRHHHPARVEVPAERPAPRLRPALHPRGTGQAPLIAAQSPRPHRRITRTPRTYNSVLPLRILSASSAERLPTAPRAPSHIGRTGEHPLLRAPSTALTRFCGRAILRSGCRHGRATTNVPPSHARLPRRRPRGPLSESSSRANEEVSHDPTGHRSRGRARVRGRVRGGVRGRGRVRGRVPRELELESEYEHEDEAFLRGPRRHRQRPRRAPRRGGGRG